MDNCLHIYIIGFGGSACYCFTNIPDNFPEAVPPLSLELLVNWSHSGCFLVDVADTAWQM